MPINEHLFNVIEVDGLTNIDLPKIRALGIAIRTGEEMTKLATLLAHDLDVMSYAPGYIVEFMGFLAELIKMGVVPAQMASSLSPHSSKRMRS